MSTESTLHYEALQNPEMQRAINVIPADRPVPIGAVPYLRIAAFQRGDVVAFNPGHFGELMRENIVPLDWKEYVYQYTVIDKEENNSFTQACLIVPIHKIIDVARGFPERANEFLRQVIAELVTRNFAAALHAVNSDITPEGSQISFNQEAELGAYLQANAAEKLLHELKNANISIDEKVVGELNSEIVEARSGQGVTSLPLPAAII